MASTQLRAVDIRWHGRGGQGAKTAALLTAKAVAATDMHVRGFPEYGPERMGAPIRAFTRLSEDPIRDQSQIYEPNVVVVLDASLISSEPILQGVPEDGCVVVNANQDPKQIREQLDAGSRNVFVVDAGRISREAIGRNLPNTTMMGALAKACDLIEWDSFKPELRHALEAKFHDEDLVEANMKAVERAYEEVRAA